MAKTATNTAKKSIYGVHPGVLMTQKWIAELKMKTGRSLDDWLKVIKKEGPREESERRDWMKSKFGLGTNSAWWLAERSFGKGEEVSDPDLYLPRLRNMSKKCSRVRRKDSGRSMTRC